MSLRNLTDVEQEYSRTQEAVVGDGHQDMLVSVCACAPSNPRITIDDDEEMLPAEDFLCSDDDTNEKYLSRDAIKSEMQTLVESASLRKRRRKKRNKSIDA